MSAPAKLSRASARMALLLLISCLCALVAAWGWGLSDRGSAPARVGLAQPQSLASAQQLVASLAGAQEGAKLVAVNDFYNQRIAFATDPQAWGQVDYWATPGETLRAGQGDCEDFVIAKFFTLIASGVPPQRLRLYYVRWRPQGQPDQAHMALGYLKGPAEDPLILDNLATDIVPLSARVDLVGVFSFNLDGIWSAVNGSTMGDPMNRLSKWRDLLARASEQGFSTTGVESVLAKRPGEIAPGLTLSRSKP